jgi:hypothetical protein
MVWAVRTECSHDTKRNTKREKNLGDCRRPDVTSFGKNTNVPASNILLDSFAAAFESKGPAQEDKKKDNRKALNHTQEQVNQSNYKSMDFEGIRNPHIPL